MGKGCKFFQMKLEQFNGLFLVGSRDAERFVVVVVFKYGNLQKYIIRTGKVR